VAFWWTGPGDYEMGVRHTTSCYINGRDEGISDYNLGKDIYLKHQEHGERCQDLLIWSLFLPHLKLKVYSIMLAIIRSAPP
jgi:hypothetical protein